MDTSFILSTLLPYLLVFLGVVFVALLVLFLLVMSCKPTERWVGRGLGLSGKNRILTFLGLGIGGILVVMQVVIAREDVAALREAVAVQAKAANVQAKAAKAQAKAAKAQAKAAEEQARANHNTEQGHRQERLKNAVEHLGHVSDSVRLGGAYELIHLAIDTKNLRWTIWEMLCDHIRLTTSKKEYREKYKSKPSEEMQSLLNLLFVRHYAIFKGMHIKLRESWLNGAEIIGARLHNADLREVRLQGARLAHAQFQGAYLYGAQLQGADLWKAHLQGAHLHGAHLQGATLYFAQLQGADLRNVQLQEADLRGAQFQGATLWNTQFQGTALGEAQFQGAAGGYDPDESFEERMRRLVNKESDLSEVIFEGGLTKKDVDSIVEGFSDKRATALRKRLEPHINKPISSQLPANSGADTGAYTAEEAEEWIAEYEEAVPKFPGSIAELE